MLDFGGGRIEMAEDVIIKLYHWSAKKRYLDGKYIYTYERVYIPVPQVFHEKFRSLLKQHLKMELERAQTIQYLKL